MLGGRGSGKTRTGAEWLVKAAVQTAADWAVVAPTYGDARKTCVEGPSGILKVAGPLVTKYNRSSGEIWLADSYIRMDGADDGALRIQGSNLAGAWCDEVGLWRDWETAWNESLAFAVRIDPARICATGRGGGPRITCACASPRASRAEPAPGGGCAGPLGALSLMSGPSSSQRMRRS